MGQEAIKAFSGKAAEWFGLEGVWYKTFIASKIDILVLESVILEGYAE